MTNAELLHHPPAVLTIIEKQQRFVLQCATIPRACPCCDLNPTQVDADVVARGDLERFDPDGPERRYECPGCKTELAVVVPVIGEVQWIRASRVRAQHKPKP